MCCWQRTGKQLSVMIPTRYIMATCRLYSICCKIQPPFFRSFNFHQGIRTMSTVTVPRELDPQTTFEGAGLLKIFESNQKRLKRIKFLGNIFRRKNFELRIAGGAVRDLLNGTESKDIDLATDAKPEDSLEILKEYEHILRIITTAAGQKHGTVAVKFREIDFVKDNTQPEYDDESPYEITTLRTDLITDGRHAEVKFINDWSLDAERRDLTINAMFLTLDKGTLVDYYNGESDLKNGIVRFVGDADRRMKEDYLRILRFFRFWTRYGKNNPPDAETFTVIERNLPGLNGISGERLWQEIKKIFSYLPCDAVVKLMLDLKLFTYLGVTDEAILENYEEYCNSALEKIRLVQIPVKKYLEDYKNADNSKDTNPDMTKKFYELMPVILFAPLIKSNSMFESAWLRMKFSNLERDSILYCKDRPNCESLAQDFIINLAMTPNSKRQDLMLKEAVYMAYLGRFEEFDRIKSIKLPDFPVHGGLVVQELETRKLPNKLARNVINELQKYWATNKFEPTKEELITVMNERLDKMKSN